MAASRTAKVAIIGDASSLKRAATEAEKALGKLTGSATAASKETEKLGAGQGFSKMGTAMAAAGVAAVAFGKKSMDTFQDVGTEILKLQRYTGGTAEDMSRLRFAAQQTGTDVDTLAKSMGIASKNLEKSKDPMKDFGVALKGANGEARPMNDILLDLSAKFSTMPNGTEKTALAMKLFGKAGMDMMPFLNRGPAALRDLMQETDQYGMVLDGPALQAVKDAKEAHRQFDAAVEGLQVKIGAGLTPAMTALTRVMTAVPQGVNDVMIPMLALGAATYALRGPLSAVASGASAAARGIADWATSAGKVGPAMNDAINGSETLGKSSMTMKGALAAAGAGMVIGAIYAKQYGDAMKEAAEAGKSLSDKALAAGSKGGYQGMVNQLGKVDEQAKSLQEDMDNLHFYDATKKNDMTMWMNGLSDAHNKMAAMIQLTDALSGATGKNKDEVMLWLQQQEKAGITFKTVTEAMQAYTGSEEKATSAADDGKEATKRWNDQLQHHRDELQKTKDGYDAIMDARFSLMSGNLDIRSADRDVRAAQKALADMQKEGGHTPDEIEAAQDRIAQAVQRRAQAEIEQADKVKVATTGAHITNDEKLKIYNDTIDKTLQKYGLWQTKADELKVKVDGVLQSQKDLLAQQQTQSITDWFNQGLNKFGDLLSFGDGGIVPGAVGSPQLIMAHGGETILPTHKSSTYAPTYHLPGLTGPEADAFVRSREARELAMVS